MRSIGVFFLLWASIAVASVAWALATPLTASPDEPAHIVKAASVVRGELVGEDTAKPFMKEVDIPVGLSQVNGITCYAFQPTVTAACIGDLEDGTRLESATTTAGLYNPTYYAIAGLPSLVIADPETAIFAMRALSAIVSSWFLAIAGLALFRFCNGLIASIALVALTTPMVFFMNGSVNPNSLEYSAAAALLASLLLILRERNGISTRGWFFVAVVSGVLLANARGSGPFWLAIVGLVAMFSGTRQRYRELIRHWAAYFVSALVLLALGAVAALYWNVNTNTLAQMGTHVGAGEISPVQAFIVTLVERPTDIGLIGQFGWLDTVSFAPVYVIWSMLAGGLVLAAFMFARGGILVSLSVAFLAFVVAPAALQASTVLSTGYIWQGRYTLVIYVCVLVVAGVVLSEALPRIRLTDRAVRRLSVALGVLVIAGHVLAMVAAEKRYAIGVTGKWGDFLLHPEWTPPGGIYVWPVVMVVSLVLMFVSFLLLSRDSGAHRTVESGSDVDQHGAGAAEPRTVTAS